MGREWDLNVSAGLDGVRSGISLTRRIRVEWYGVG
jgi:hypothetical protein